MAYHLCVAIPFVICTLARNRKDVFSFNIDVKTVLIFRFIVEYSPEYVNKEIPYTSEDSGTCPNTQANLYINMLSKRPLYLGTDWYLLIGHGIVALSFFFFILSKLVFV